MKLTGRMPENRTFPLQLACDIYRCSTISAKKNVAIKLNVNCVTNAFEAAEAPCQRLAKYAHPPQSKPKKQAAKNA